MDYIEMSVSQNEKAGIKQPKSTAIIEKKKKK